MDSNGWGGKRWLTVTLMPVFLCLNSLLLLLLLLHSLRGVCRYDLSIQSVALAFAWAPQCVTRVAVGVKSVPELTENVKSLRASVPRQLWLDAKKEGLLPPTIHFPK